MEPLFSLQACLFESEDPFLQPGEVRCTLDLNKDSYWATKPTALQANTSYWWLWDTGDGNGYTVGGNKPTDYSQALAKGVPYWKSLWGKWGSANIWMRIPTNGWNSTTGSQFDWGKPTPEFINAVIRSGPFVEKNNKGVVSINMKFKFKFQFGGPDLTYGELPGPAPKDIPPTTAPYTLPTGLEADDLAEYTQGVLMPWDVRRGIITQRGYTRLTKGILSDTEGVPKKSEQEETAHELSSSESEESESEEESSEEEDDGELQRQLELIRQLRLMATPNL